MLRSGVFNVPMPYMAFVACQLTAFLRFAQAIVWTFLDTNALQRDLLCVKKSFYGTAFAA
jgi:hypothetical protein